jgi:hypothetical protein
MRHAGKRGVGIGDSGQHSALGRSNRRRMLISRDLAKPDDGDAKRVHDSSPG